MQQMRLQSKNTLKTKIAIFLTVLIGLYSSLCCILYFSQESIIFFPEKLDKNYKFRFEGDYEEQKIKTHDGIFLHGLLFKTHNPKGVIFYLHGNSENLSSWGYIAKTYTDLNYDIFILDYRGYGKSEGKIINESQLFADNQIAYNHIKKRYSENTIIVLGYSIGSGMAAKLASTNNPKMLVLQAPYYSLSDVMKHKFPFVPTFILKYQFATHNYVKNCKSPVVVFHGDQDEVIDHGHSLKLKNEFKKQDTFITLPEQYHNGMNENSHYKIELAKLL